MKNTGSAIFVANEINKNLHIVNFLRRFISKTSLIINIFCCFFFQLLYCCYVFPILFILTLASDRAVLYGNVAFSILVLSSKKNYSSLLKRVCVFQKICLGVEVLKSFKISSNCHIKTCRSLKRRAILKTLSIFFRRTYAFKMKPLRKSVCLVKAKTNWNFSVNLAEKRWKKQPLISVYLMNHIFQTSGFFNMWQ